MEFPKNLQYKILNLQGHSKTCVKLTPDRTAVKHGESFRCKLPSNTLNYFHDFRMGHTRLQKMFVIYESFHVL